MGNKKFLQQWFGLVEDNREDQYGISLDRYTSMEAAKSDISKKQVVSEAHCSHEVFV